MKMQLLDTLSAVRTMLGVWPLRPQAFWTDLHEMRELRRAQKCRDIDTTRRKLLLLEARKPTKSEHDCVQH